MIPLDEAQAHVFDRCPVPVATTVALDGALGLVLAEAVVATEAVPPFANTAMDGFALRSADTIGAPVRLAVVGTLAAGAVFEQVVGRGEAVRIMTGAPMPSGADAVVMVERTSVSGPVDAEQVEVKVEVPVFRRPRVGVISTGDELVADGGTLAPGQIRDSNRPGLLALVQESGFEGVDLGLVLDDEEAIEVALRAGVEACDALLTTGGVSMGDFDYVKVVLDRIGDMRWMQVAIRPAKPLAFGTVDGVPVFGLPGNPVSSMVSFELFARPALRAMAGHTATERPLVRAVADGAMTRRVDGKTHFARVVVDYRDGAYHVSSAGGQGSHQLTAMAGADGLAVLPDGDGVADGAEVEVLILR